MQRSDLVSALALPPRVESIDEGLKLVKLETRVTAAIGYCARVSLVDGVLIDTGFPKARPALAAALAAVLVDDRVDRVVITHCHEDHAGNAAFMASRYGVEVLAPSATVASIRDPRRLHMTAYRRVIWGKPEPGQATPLRDVVETRRGALQVIPTPGHTADHVVFYDPRRSWLFSGDLFLGERVLMARPVENTADLIASLRHIIALDPEVLFCSHRGRIPHPRQALLRKTELLEEVRGRVLDLRDTGASVDEIRERVLGRERPLTYFLTWGDFSKRYFVKACLKAPGERVGC